MIKKISEATKGKAIVIGSIPPIVFVLVGMLCLVIDYATRINSAWLTLPLLSIGLIWFAGGFSVFVVFENWPQDDSGDNR